MPPLAGPPTAPKPPQIRFVTARDFPPFNFLDADGRLTGYNVELARAICVRLAIPCTIQVRPFPLLVATVDENNADAIVAGVADTPSLRAYVQHTVPYFRLPARFVTLREDAGAEASPERLGAATVAVVGGTRHADFLEDHFPMVRRIETDSLSAALDAVRVGAADAAFASGLAASFWLAGPDGTCCAFRGGPFTEAAYFGKGMSIAVAAANDPLRDALNETLAGLEQDGTLADLALRFFPIPLY